MQGCEWPLCQIQDKYRISFVEIQDNTGFNHWNTGYTGFFFIEKAICTLGNSVEKGCQLQYLNCAGLGVAPST